MLRRALALTTALAAVAAPALAQRADENAVRSADDAFGTSIGNERVGLYNQGNARGFSPTAAGNVRIEGLYFDLKQGLPSRLVANSQVRIGLTAQSYPFPAPTGIVDYTFKPYADKNSASLFTQLGPNRSYFFELEGARNLVPGKLSVAGGVVLRREEYLPRSPQKTAGMGLVSRWRPAPGTEVMGFYGYGQINDQVTQSVIFTSGPFLPPQIKAQNFAQEWTASDSMAESFGATIRQPLGEHWSVNAGLFQYNFAWDGFVGDVFLNSDANGLAASHRFSNDPHNELTSTSGEAKLTGVFRGDHLRHTIFFSARGRHSERDFGGTALASAGTAQIGVLKDVTEPNWIYGPASLDEITQTALGAGYQLTWRGVGEASVGMLQPDYQKIVTPPGRAAIVTADRPPLWNATAALTLTPKLALYGSFTRGLEDSFNAPDIATNAQEAPPAIITQQYDYGLRYALTKQLKLVAGYFNIEKPYFNLDPALLWRQLGTERHTGVEVSFSGQIGKNLTAVAGVVAMDPVVEGDAVTFGLIGPRPVAQPKITSRFNLDYNIPQIEGLSVNGEYSYSGDRAASSRTFAALGGGQLEAPGFPYITLGARYRFKLGGHNSSIRARVMNVTDEFAYYVTGSGGFGPVEPRTFSVSLASDF